MFLDCPACLDEEGAVRCGLPAEVTCRLTMRSTGGPLESAMIRCPAGHWFNGPVESLTWPNSHKPDPGPAASAGTPTTTPAAPCTTGTAGAGTSPPGRPSHRHRPAACTAIP